MDTDDAAPRPKATPASDASELAQIKAQLADMQDKLSKL